MRKYLMIVMMAMLLAPIALAIETECSGIITTSDLNCSIITTWEYPNACNTYTMKVYNSTPALLDTRALSDSTIPGRCNTTFNYTKVGSYTFNISDGGDSGTIIVEVDDEMILAMVAGVGLIAALFLYFAFNLKDNHFFLKLLCIFFALITIMVIPSMLINETGGSELVLLNVVTWFFRLFIIYIVIYLFYDWTQKSEKFMDFFNSLKRR